MSFITDNLVTRNYTVRLFLSSIILTLSSANFAFDNQGFAQTQAMAPFQRRFGEYNPHVKKYALPSSFLSYSNAFPFLLLICGVIIGSTISSKYGRRMTVFTMSLWALICVPIILTSTTRNQFLAGRCLNSIYIGMEMSVIPVFQSEIVPAAVRGLAVGSYQMSFGIGGFVITAICRRTSRIPNDWSWRIVFLCYLVVPSIIAALIWFQPESPRWLVQQGRIDEARRSLNLFRKQGHDVEGELQQIILSAELERKSHEKAGYRQCFRGFSRRRTLIVLGSNFFLQATGQAFVSLYGPIIVGQIGGIEVFNYTLISASVGFVGYLFVLALNDKLGRRAIMIGGSAMQAISMFLVAGLGQVSNRTYNVQVAIISFIVIYGFAFAIGWAPISYILSAEIPSQQLRDKTSQMGFIIGVFVQFVVAFSLPYMVNEPGWMGMKVGFIFGPICVLAVLFAYFAVPECKGLGLEQVDLLFEEGISARHSRAWSVAHRDVKRTEEPSTGRRESEADKGELSVTSPVDVLSKV